MLNYKASKIFKNKLNWSDAFEEQKQEIFLLKLTLEVIVALYQG